MTAIQTILILSFPMIAILGFIFYDKISADLYYYKQHLGGKVPREDKYTFQEFIETINGFKAQPCKDLVYLPGDRIDGYFDNPLYETPAYTLTKERIVLNDSYDLKMTFFGYLKYREWHRQALLKGGA